MPTYRKTSTRRQGQPISAAAKARAQAAFLRVFAERGIVLDGAAAAGVSRETIYQWRKTDAAFGARYELAEADANDRINKEIWRRGVDGWDEVQTTETVDENGETTKIETKRAHHFSDGMLRLVAQARMPHLYRDRMDLTTNDETIGGLGNGSITQIINDPAAAQLACDLIARAGQSSTGSGGRAGHAPSAGGDAGGPGVPGN